ncbi:putative baseplate assembly protein [Granulicella sibirica]|nr:putative baseplate assembly protein [Granulicella sibirica]
MGTHGSFFESMIARLSSLALDVAEGDADPTLTRVYPLRALTTRELSDPSIALLDAWATVADVLTFYQERIANEGYLRTATEHRSILELAGLVGYRLRPPVSASVYLAFTVIDGFNGVIPSGARAQSIPGPGEQPQFFESSIDLAARDVWNALVPRTTRSQFISFSADATKNGTEGTDAATRDTMYFTGLTTNLTAGDNILIQAGEDGSFVQLRLIRTVDAQAGANRTEVTLDRPASNFTGTAASIASSIFQPYIDEAASIFVDIDLGNQVSNLLTTFLKNVALTDDPASLAASIRPQIEGWHDLSVKRRFSRLEPWLADLLRDISQFRRQVSGYGNGSYSGGKPFAPAPTGAGGLAGEESGYKPLPMLATLQQGAPGSALTKLSQVLTPLALPPSVQPANAVRLKRNVQQAFSRQSDLAPRLLTALHPRVAPTLYKAWSGAQAASAQVSVSAIRVKAGLFASTSSGLPGYDGNNKLIGFGGVSIKPAWGSLAPDTGALPTVALDSTYNKVVAGTWIAISRPDIIGGTATPITTYHQVVSVNTVTMSAMAEVDNAAAGTGAGASKTLVSYGYNAKSTQLTVNPPWLDDLADNSDSLTKFLGSETALRGTVVYAQAEELGLADEPLDNDIEGSTIELANLYDGLDSGRWIVVSGERTDVPGTTGVTASELAMIASVKQGSRSLLSVDFPTGIVPFKQIAYYTDANSNGDRLAVGTPGSTTSTLPLPTVTNQEYSDEVQLAPGVYASAYVPTQDERIGNFGDFAGLLVDPVNNQPFPDGVIPASRLSDTIAWRITTRPVHTILTLANALAYTYDPANTTINANVVLATNGQTTGEVLGNGDASEAFQSFDLHMSPLTYLPAPTPLGAQSTLTVRVNEIAWSETDNFVLSGPRDREYVTQADDTDQTKVTFGNGTHGARVPSGNGNVKATYRFGTGSAGNVAANQISQLATQPLGVKSVINPLASSGGADGDTTDQARSNVPIALLALDRLVSVSDYASFARAYAGIAKASSALISDGRRLTIHLTIAGNGDIVIDPNSLFYQNLLLALMKYGELRQPLQLAQRGSKLLVISAGVKLLPDYEVESVFPAIRSALLALYSFETRDFGQSAYLSEAIAAIQAVEGVAYLNVTTFASVADTVTGDQLAALGSTLGLQQVVTAKLARIDPTQTDPALRILAAQLVTLSPDIQDTLILTEISA